MGELGGDDSILEVSLGGETIVGAGVLAGVIGLRWSVGRWEKAKRNFWADWERVGKGLTRDLTVSPQPESAYWRLCC